MIDQEKLYKNRNKHILIIIGLVILNLIIYNIFVKNGGYNSKGEYLPYDSMYALKSSLTAFLIGLPIISLILGLLIALFPFKELPFKKKYLRGSLLTLLTLNGLITFGLTSIMIFTFMGFYPSQNQDNLLSKEKRINEFKSEIKVLCDSSDYYLDLGLEALKKGEDPKEISKKLSPKLISIEGQIDTKTKEFQKTAINMKFSEQEYKNVFSDITKYIQPISEKFLEIEEQGIEIK